MPFTLSHIAAVLPLRSRGGSPGSATGGLHLPFAALVIGSMTPDLPYFLPGVPMGLARTLTHSLLGIPTLNLLLGAAVWWGWWALEPALHELAPDVVRERWRLSHQRPAWWGVLLAVMIGALTHIAWDTFTHVDGWAVTQLPILLASYPSPIGPLPGFRWAQYLSGVLGLAAVVWVAWRAPRRQPAPRTVPQRSGVAAVLGGAAAGLALRTLMIDWSSTDPHGLLFAAVTSAMAGACAGLVTAALLVHRRARMTRP